MIYVKQIFCRYLANSLYRGTGKSIYTVILHILRELLEVTIGKVEGLACQEFVVANEDLLLKKREHHSILIFGPFGQK